MRSKILPFCLLLVMGQRPAIAQATVDVLGMHNLSVGSGSPVTSAGSLGCTFCHAPHSGTGSIAPLWNQTFSKQTYTPYSSPSYHQQGNTLPPLGRPSSMCLSCHDGSVAVGQSVAYGKIPTSGTMSNNDILGTQLKGSHPFSLVTSNDRVTDSPDLAASLATLGVTADPLHKVKLNKGNVECTSCHNPHLQRVDPIVPNFLVRDSSNGQLCLACHDPNRVITGKVNPIAGWATSIHATWNNPSGQSNVGSYSTVAMNACTSCHTSHGAPGPLQLLRGATPPAPTLDATTQNCMTCHNGGSSISPSAPNVFAEFAKVGHPFPAATNLHDAGVGTVLNNYDAAEPAVLDNNRHATCTDCHNPHAADHVSTPFSGPPLIRPSQKGVTGISAADSLSVLSPALNQYENCLRCHGTSSGKIANSVFGYLPAFANSAGDPLNVILQFGANAVSSHPVMHDFSSTLAQPSILVYMKNLDGTTDGRLMGTRILCTDCHNSDDNREFGGTGPNGPHGSKWTHILERRYEFTQLPAGTAPGQPVPDGNLFKTPNLSAAGPYALCAKCHDLQNQILANTSFKRHLSHVSQYGFSCSVCHTSHGVAQAGNIPGVGLVNFDANVVAANGSSPVSYTPGSDSCTLKCHGYDHNQDGTITPSLLRSVGGAGLRVK